MQRTVVVGAAMTVACILVGGCGKERAQVKAAKEAAKEFEKMAQQMQKEAGAGQQQSPQDLGAALNAMQKAITAGGATNVQLVDFRELKGMLPLELPKLKRTSATGERSGAMGISVSMAEARYEGDDDASIEIKITDMGGMKGVAMMAQFGWAAGAVDRETDSGYERTVTIDGHKGYEEYNTQSKSGELKVLVGGRFMVELQGNNVEMARVKEAFAKLPVNKLVADAK